MSVTVRTNNVNSIRINQGARPEGAVVIRKTGDITVQGLSNVVSTDLQDGYTLVYDSDTNTWITQQIDGGAIGSVDGGYY